MKHGPAHTRDLMSPRLRDDGDERSRAMLDALGVPAAEEALYRELLGRPDGTLAELAEATGDGPSRIRRRLRSLEGRGMLTRTTGRPVRYRPAPPELAIEALARPRQQDVDRARLAARQLDTLWRTGAGARGPVVRIVPGGADAARHLLQAQSAAREEVLVLDHPLGTAGAAVRQKEVQLDRMAHGVRYRTVYDRASLAAAGRLDLAHGLARHGERARTVDALPLALLVADRTTALVPVGLPGRRQGLAVLAPSPLLDAMAALFESLWERGTPLRPAARPAAEPSAQNGRLLRLAAEGHTDEAIARRLGVTRRTVERRMRRVMDELGARSRFQAGVQAARRGLLD